jgi:hypothetical protein
MPRSAQDRINKYENKDDADVVRSRILAQKANMVAQMNIKVADLAALETQIKAYIEGQTTPVYGAMVPQYLNVGRELYKKSKQFGSATFELEAQIVLTKWATRGLDEGLLNGIAALFGTAWAGL